MTLKQAVSHVDSGKTGFPTPMRSIHRQFGPIVDVLC